MFPSKNYTLTSILCIGIFFSYFILPSQTLAQFTPLPGGSGGTQYASEVINFTQGLRANGTPVLPERGNTDLALGAPQSDGSEYDNPPQFGQFISLGFGGSITLGFNQPIINVPGPDISLFEITGGISYPPETVKVEVSLNGTSWTVLTTSSQKDISLDLGTLSSAKYLRITDVSDVSLFVTDPTADGYDLDAVAATKDNSTSFTPQCSDGIDNDNDGRIDYPNDYGCTSSQDNDETDIAGVSPTKRVAVITTKYRDLSSPTFNKNDLMLRSDKVTDYYLKELLGTERVEFVYVSSDWTTLTKKFSDYNSWPIQIVPTEYDCASDTLKGGCVDILLDSVREAGEDLQNFDGIVVMQSTRLRPFMLNKSSRDWLLQNGHSDVSFCAGKCLLVSPHIGYVSWTHELGHVLFDLPDYYPEGKNTYSNNGSVHTWDVMGGNRLNPPAPIMAINKANLGLFNYDVYSGTNVGVYDIPQLSNMRQGDTLLTYSAPKGYSDYFVAEGRNPIFDRTEVDPYDNNTSAWSEIDATPGVMIYKVLKDVNAKTGLPYVFSLPGYGYNFKRVTLGLEEEYIDDEAGVVFSLKPGHGSDVYELTLTPRTLKSRTVVSLKPVTFPSGGNGYISWLPSADNELQPDVDLVFNVNSVDSTEDTDAQDVRYSGDFSGGGPEWISFPVGADITTSVDISEAAQWAEETDVTIDDLNIEYSVREYDQSGNLTAEFEINTPVSLLDNLSIPVNAQDLILETLEWAESEGKERRLVNMLSNALKEQFWSNNNTLASDGIESVPDLLSNAIKFLGDTNPYRTQRLKLVLEIISDL